jgi:hypothetical protein
MSCGCRTVILSTRRQAQEAVSYLLKVLKAN